LANPGYVFEMEANLQSALLVKLLVQRPCCDCCSLCTFVNCIALLIFCARSTFTCVLFYVAPPTVVQLNKVKSYIRLFVRNWCLWVPKIIRFGQSVWKIQAKMWVGPIFGPHGIHEVNCNIWKAHSETYSVT